MSRIGRVCVVTLSLCLCIPGLAAAQPYSWKTIKVADGPYDTSTWALNDEDLILGHWEERDVPVDPASGNFRYQRTFKPPFYHYTNPGASWFLATGINEARDHVGYYREPCGCPEGGFRLHGFLRRGADASILILDYPDPRAFWTFPMGLNDRGQIVGGYYYTDANGATHWENFLWDNGTWTTLPPIPGAERTEISAINNHGEMVGLVVEPSPENPFELWTRGLIRSGGIDWRVDIPNSVETVFTGINDWGQVVGRTYHPTGWRGVLLDEGTVTLLDGPQNGQPRQTYLRDINNHGHIIGYTRRDPGDGYTIGIHGTPKPTKTVQAR